MDITQDALNQSPPTLPEYDVQKSSVRFAGFCMRFWAYLVDGIVIFSINGILLSPLQFINEGIPIDVGYWTVNGIIGGLIFYSYFLIMTKLFSQTVGKMIFGIKVIKHNGSPLLWSDLIFREGIGRFIYKILPIVMVLYVVVG